MTWFSDKCKSLYKLNRAETRWLAKQLDDIWCGAWACFLPLTNEKFDDTRRRTITHKQFEEKCAFACKCACAVLLNRSGLTGSEHDNAKVRDAFKREFATALNVQVEYPFEFYYDTKKRAFVVSVDEYQWITSQEMAIQDKQKDINE